MCPVRNVTYVSGRTINDLALNSLKQKKPHREVVWVNLADFDRCLLLLLPLWACGQRFFSVVHMPTAMTWGCRWFGRPDLMMVGRERAVRQFRNLAAL